LHDVRLPTGVDPRRSAHVAARHRDLIARSTLLAGTPERSPCDRKEQHVVVSAASSRAEIAADAALQVTKERHRLGEACIPGSPMDLEALGGEEPAAQLALVRRPQHIHDLAASDTLRRY